MQSIEEASRSVGVCFGTEVERERRPARMREWLGTNPIEPNITIVRVVSEYDHEELVLTRCAFGIYQGNDDAAVILTDGDNTWTVQFDVIRSFSALPLTAVVRVLNFVPSQIPFG